ncbi:MAG: PAAR domain-containing protein [Bacteroidota bacterium]
MPGAARVGDMHTCPLSDGPKPHVGGPVLPAGAIPTVLINGQMAAVMGTLCFCVGPPDSIAIGSPTVMIGGKQAARMGDTTNHGGSVTMGSPNVIIG